MTDKNIKAGQLNKMHENKDIKGMFQQAKKQMGWKTTGSPLAFLRDGKMIRSPKEIANIQMLHFPWQDKKP